MSSAVTEQLCSQIEAVILASDDPVSMAKLRGLLSEEIQSSDIRGAIGELEAHYQQRGIRLEKVAGGWQFRTAPEHAELIQAMWQIKPQKLSRSALETLAIIAYRQPTTRAEIEALRGVKVSSQMIATLQERGWIKVLGRKEVPGRPHLYGTGRQFLIDFGLESLKDLPESSQLMDEDEIQQMVMENIDQPTESDETDKATQNSREENEQEEQQPIQASGG